MSRPLPSLLRALAPALALVAGAAAVAHAQRGLPPVGDQGMRNALPQQLEGVDVKERLGQPLDLDLEVVHHDGRTVPLRSFFDGETPVLVTLNWFNCKTLCDTQLNKLLEALQRFEWTAGKEFRILTLSFDPREDAELAAGKRRSYVDALGRGEVDWSFLTSPGRSVKQIADQLGFSYTYDADLDLYAHTTVLFVLGGDGTISRYLYGITYDVRDLKFSLIEASNGRVGSLGDKLLLSCFHYDPEAGGYNAFAFGIMRLGGIVVLVVIAAVYLTFYLRRRRRRLARTGQGTPERLTEATP